MCLSPVPVQKLEERPLTSRQTLHGPLGLEGEKEVRVPPLGPPTPSHRNSDTAGLAGLAFVRGYKQQQLPVLARDSENGDNPPARRELGLWTQWPG